MFTGIVSELAAVVEVADLPKGRRMTVALVESTPDLGESIAVNGVCLTVVDIVDQCLTFDVVHESFRLSNLSSVVAGDLVNLEKAMPANGRFNGHLVQGHVDGVGAVESRTIEGTAERIGVSLDRTLAKYVAPKGSITVDGVSLTVTKARPAWFEVVVVPHTLAVTTLGFRSVGDGVNVEVDIVAKYVERIMEAHQ